MTRHRLRGPLRSRDLLVTIDASAIPQKMTGVGRFLWNLIRGLSQLEGVEVVLVTRRGDRERWEEASPRLEVLEAAPSSRPARLAWEQLRLPGLLTDIGPDVHHGPHYSLPVLCRLPKVVTVHDMTLVEHPEWHERSKVLYFRAAIAAASRQAEVIVCDSQTTASRLQSLVGPRGDLRVVPLGVDPKRFHPGPGLEGEDLQVLARHGVQAPYVAFVGTLEPRKGAADLVRAFDAVAGSHPGLALVLAGVPGWGEAQVAEAVASSVHRDRIMRLGFIDDADVPALLRSATAVAYPSLEEGFGLPALEALACGAPLITTSGTAMEEFCKGAALLVRPGDVAALADALSRLLEGDPSAKLRRQMGLEVAQRYSWQACAQGYLGAYRAAAEAAGQPKGGPRSTSWRGRPGRGP